jgi:hypothetical protein
LPNTTSPSFKTPPPIPMPCTKPCIRHPTPPTTISSLTTRIMS